MRNMDYDPYRDAGCIGERNRCVKMDARARDAAETADGRVETAAAEVRWGREGPPGDARG